DQSANLQMDLAVIVEAFVVVVVGGMGSLPGAYLASLLIGLLQAFGIVFVPGATLVLVFVVMAAVLLIRPNGLLGRPLAQGQSAQGTPPVIRRAPAALKWLGVTCLMLAIAAPFLVGPFLLSVLTECAVAILFAASLHIMMGPGGMPSFGHAAWFGLGAYGAALAFQLGGAPIALALLAAVLLPGIVALLFGWFVVRLAGVYLAMLTLAFAQIVWAAAFQWDALTGGDNGILGLWPGGLLRSAAAFYWLTLAICV